MFWTKDKVKGTLDNFETECATTDNTEAHTICMSDANFYNQVPESQEELSNGKGEE